LIVLVKDNLELSFVDNFTAKWKLIIKKKLLVLYSFDLDKIDTTISSVICKRDVTFSIQQFKKIEHIHLLSSGSDEFFRPPDWKGRLTVSNGVNSRSIAEYLLCSILIEAKNMIHYITNQRLGNWNRLWCDELVDKKILVVGYGSIAKEFIEVARPFKLDIVIANRTIYEPNNISLGDVSRVAKEFDIVISALPLATNTLNFFDEKFFKEFSKGLFINVSRGALVDQAVLVKWLMDDPSNRTAVLDVFHEEPLPKENEIWYLPNVVCTPHIAGTTNNFLDNLFKILKGFYV
jgi:phosphoglycerate dehydrogenase-like enzyme